MNQTIPITLRRGMWKITVPSLDEKTLFYLMSRGFTKGAAENDYRNLDAVCQLPIREKTLKYLEANDRLQRTFPF